MCDALLPHTAHRRCNSLRFLDNVPFAHLRVEMTTYCFARSKLCAIRICSAYSFFVASLQPSRRTNLFYHVLRRHEHGIPCLPLSASSQMISRVHLSSAQCAELCPAIEKLDFIFLDPLLPAVCRTENIACQVLRD
jgi:hypothetical protein